jgi:hypothetical protein
MCHGSNDRGSDEKRDDAGWERRPRLVFVLLVRDEVN